MFVITAKIETFDGKEKRRYIRKGEGCESCERLVNAHKFRDKESARKYHSKYQLADIWQVRAVVRRKKK